MRSKIYLVDKFVRNDGLIQETHRVKWDGMDTEITRVWIFTDIDAKHAIISEMRFREERFDMMDQTIPTEVVDQWVHDRFDRTQKALSDAADQRRERRLLAQ